MTTFQCPNCGAVLFVSLKSKSGDWEQVPMFDLGDNTGGYELVRTTPTRSPTPSGDLVVPALQAAITSASVSLLAGTVTLVNHWPWWVPAGAFSGSFVLAWMWLLTDHRSLLKVTETITRLGDKPDPTPPAAQTLRLEVKEQRGQHSDTLRWLDLPCDVETFKHIARGVLAGRSLSEREWTGRGGAISVNKFRELRTQLLATGYIRERSRGNPNQGVELTAKGQALFKEIVK